MMYELTRAAFLKLYENRIYLPNSYSYHNYISSAVESLCTQWKVAVTLGLTVFVT